MELKKSIHAVKAVSINEPFFQGHFPGRPIMPGVLLVKAIAQAAGIFAVESPGLAGSGKLVYFLAIDGAKFRAPVDPGCLVAFNGDVTQIRGNIYKFAATAADNDKLERKNGG